MSVILSTGGSHVTMTHDSIGHVTTQGPPFHLTEQGPGPTLPHPRNVLTCLTSCLLIKSYIELNKQFAVYFCYYFRGLLCLPKLKRGLNISELSQLKFSIVVPFVSFIDDVTYFHVKCPVFRCESAISSLFCK